MTVQFLEQYFLGLCCSKKHGFDAHEVKCYTGRFLDVFALLEAVPSVGRLHLKPYLPQFANGERWSLADYIHAHFVKYMRMRMTEE